jgi:transposase
MSKAYSSNLTQWQWELIEPLIPAAKPGGRDREVEIWSVLNAIFYVLTQGCTWRNLPGDIRRMADGVSLLCVAGDPPRSELATRWNMGHNS